MVFPVQHPLFKFKSRTHTGLCLLFILMHDSLLPSPCSSYWSIQALQASLQFALNPIPTDQLSGQQQQQQQRLANLTHIRILLNSLVGAMAKKAWIKNKCWTCNKSKKKVKNTHDKQAKKVNNHFGISLSPVRICRFVVFFHFFALFSHELSIYSTTITKAKTTIKL